MAGCARRSRSSPGKRAGRTLGSTLFDVLSTSLDPDELLPKFTSLVTSAGLSLENKVRATPH